MHVQHSRKPAVVEMIDRAFAAGRQYPWPYVIYSGGLRFEKSGASMAVYNAATGYPDDAPYDARKIDHAKRTFIERIDLPDGAEATFLMAVDRYLLDRYVADAEIVASEVA